MIKRPWNKSEDALLIRLINAGATEQEAATALNRTIDSVSSRVRRLKRMGAIKMNIDKKKVKDETLNKGE